MSRLHLITSRKPLSGAVTAGDTLVFLDAQGAHGLIDKILSDNPQISSTDLQVVSQAEEGADIQLKAINYKTLVELVASCDSVVSW